MAKMRDYASWPMDGSGYGSMAWDTAGRVEEKRRMIRGEWPEDAASFTLMGATVRVPERLSHALSSGAVTLNVASYSESTYRVTLNTPAAVLCWWELKLDRATLHMTSYVAEEVRVLLARIDQWVLEASNSRATELYAKSSLGELMPGFVEPLLDGRVFKYWTDGAGRRGTTLETPDGSVYAVATPEPVRRIDEEMKKVLMTSEGSLGDSREILSTRARELAVELSKVLRQDPQAFQELKKGGTLARDVTIVVAGQRISVTLQLDGLGEETEAMA